MLSLGGVVRVVTGSVGGAVEADAWIAMVCSVSLGVGETRWLVSEEFSGAGGSLRMTCSSSSRFLQPLILVQIGG